jgi:ribosomal protein L18E
VHAHKFSGKAAEKIAAAGGATEVLVVPKLAKKADKKKADK